MMHNETKENAQSGNKADGDKNDKPTPDTVPPVEVPGREETPEHIPEKAGDHAKNPIPKP